MAQVSFEQIEGMLTADMRRTLLRLVDARRMIEGECWIMVSRTFGGTFVRTVGNGESANWTDVDPGWLDDLVKLGLLDIRSGRSPSYRITGDGERFAAWLTSRAGAAIDEVERQVVALVDAAGFAERHPAAAQGLSEAMSLVVTPKLDGNVIRRIGVLCRHALQDVGAQVADGDHAEKPVDALATWRSGVELEPRQAAVIDALAELTRRCLAVDQGATHIKEAPERFQTTDEVRRAVFLTAVTCFEIDRSVQLSRRG